jgi:hypothetical protein
MGETNKKRKLLPAPNIVEKVISDCRDSAQEIPLPAGVVVAYLVGERRALKQVMHIAPGWSSMCRMNGSNCSARGNLQN